MIDVLSEQQQGELRHDPLPADSGKAWAWRSIACSVCQSSLKPSWETKPSGAQEPQRILAKSLVRISNRAH